MACEGRGQRLGGRGHGGEERRYNEKNAVECDAAENKGEAEKERGRTKRSMQNRGGASNHT